MLLSFPPAILALADGTVFRDYSIDTAGHTTDEMVFNTAVTGYQEILIDPDYSRQIITLAYPHIGNIGANREDIEATKVHAADLIIEDLPVLTSNFRKEHTLSYYLKDERVAAIVGINARRLTRILREKGAQNGCILASEGSVQRTIDLSRSFLGLLSMDLVKVMSVTRPYRWTQTEQALDRGYGKQEAPKYHVVAYDFGVKFNILRILAERGCRMIVMPAQASATDVLAHNPDGVFLSNGPGDPELCDYAIATTKEFLERRLPTFGICLGHQIMGLAVGARMLKMKTGHHGASHPVKDLQDGRMVVTSQNHGFAVDPESLPANAHATHVSLFDGTLQGFELTDRPAFCLRGHPETSPGPHDVACLFDRFTTTMGVAKR